MPEHPVTDTRPLQLLVWVGAAPPPPMDEVKVVHLTPQGTSAPEVIEAVRATGLTPADLRSHAVVGFAGDVPAMLAVTVYIAVITLAARRLDVLCGARTAHLVSLDHKLRRVPDTGIPAAPVLCAQVGAPHATLPVAELDGPAAAAGIALVRHARRLRLAVADDTIMALTMCVAVSALRSRPGMERLPLLVTGDEPDDVDGAAGIDLDTVRAGAFELRRSLRSENHSVLAPAAPVPARLARLADAASTPIEQTMTALGATTPDGVLWHCPRPGRHRNGDANASMRVDGTGVRCFRCDPERVDSLRLTADVRGCSLDEAADWLLAARP
jgi:hypothetical protein